MYVCMSSNKLLLEFFSRYGLQTCYLIYREPYRNLYFSEGFWGVVFWHEYSLLIREMC